MAYYLVKAKPIAARLPELRARLDSGEIEAMQPFGSSLDEGLNNARLQGEGTATWEEEDYCRPPLAMERAAVLDTYFTDLSVEHVERGAGWAKIEHLPRLWQTQRSSSHSGGS